MSRTSLFGFLSAAVALLLFAGAPAEAQETGTVQGTVTAMDGSPLVGATVTVEGTPRGAITGDGGAFTIEGVPAGSQTVRVQYIGYRPASQTVDVPAGGTASVEFTLQLDPLAMGELVVTGTAVGTQKQQATYAVTTVNTQQIDQEAPDGSADLMKVIPGFHVESSGGVGGNNVFARGIPAPGSFRFLAVHEDGLPVFQAPELAFLNVDQLVRVDQTIQTMEAVRGGTANIFASNAPGGLINFVSKTGGEERQGVAKFSVGDYNLFRADFNYGGPLFDESDWRFNVGGYYRADTGVRDPGFPANRGGQIKANITKLMDDGYVRIRAKFLRDRNIFYLPVPVQGGNCLVDESPADDPCQERNEEIEAIDGFDPNFGTMTTIDAARVEIPTPQGETLEHNLRDGIETEVRQVGGEFQFDLGEGWTVKNNFRIMGGNTEFNAIFSLSNPTTATAFAQDQVSELGGTGFQYSAATSGEVIGDPTTLPFGNPAQNGLVVESGWWSVERTHDMFANELQITKEFEEVDNTLTGAFYFSDFSSDEFWNFNNILLDVQGGNGEHARLLDLTVFGTDDGTVNVTENGFTRFGSFYRNAANNGRVFAGWLQDEWSPTERVTLDAGIRYESRTLSGNTEVLDDFDISDQRSGDPETLADDNVTWGTGEFKPYNFEWDEVAFSGGVNVDVTPDRLSLFGRGTLGYRTPDFDQLAEQTTAGEPVEFQESEEVTQIEGGVKYSSPLLGAFITGFYSTLDNVPFSDEVLNPNTGETVALGILSDNKAYGVEAEVVAQPAEGFRVDLTGTIQELEISNLRFSGAPGFDVPEGTLEALDGNQTRRIPKIYFTLTPSYEAELAGNRNVRIFGSLRYLGDRFADFANRTLLPDYGKFSAGLDLGISSDVTIQTRVDNITNSVGLTEGNPRVGQLLGAPEALRMARPILGRSGQVSLVYRF
jgi:outer membrane receptor protein involved in Fe transport